jgi:flagellar basal-body rod protein FlgF
MAASGASAQMTALEATANNLANATTPGYKAEQAVFAEHLATAMLSGSGQKEMRYARVAEVASDNRQGPLQMTERPLDIAIEGDGFFAIQTPKGERYSRAGAFQVGPQGALVTTQGHAVLDASGGPLRIPPEARSVMIGGDGTLRIDGDESGQLKVVTFNDVRGLELEGEQLLRATPRSGVARPTVVTLQSGALEMPNVSIVKGMTDLVSATRAFEALQRAVESFSQLEHRAATDIMGAR